MVRCWKCGRDNEDGMRFCTNCGNPLSADAPASGADSTRFDPMQSETISFNAPQTTTPPTNWPTTPYSSAQPPPSSYSTVAAPAPKSRVGLITGIVVLLLVGLTGLAGAAGWYYYRNSSQVATTNGNANRRGLEPDSKPTPASNANATPTPAASPESKQLFEPPTTPTKEGTFTVYANKGWQMSDIAVVPLEQFRTSVDGIIDLEGVKTGVRAGGVNDAKTKSRRLYQEFPTGALLMRTRYSNGHFSNVVAAGASGNWENLPDERGMLEFSVNDNAPDGNGGQFTIKVKMTSVPKAKK